MDVKLLIDTREQKLAALVDLPFQLAQLELGDIQIKLDDQIFVLFERKTVQDLAASIKDNRYKEQKQRLLSTVQPAVKIIYLIEGNYSFTPESQYAGMSNKVLSGAIINSVVRDGIYIMQTKSIAESADLITGMFERIKKEPEKYLKGKDSIGYNPTATVSIRKKENIEKRDCLVLQLCCVPGISHKKAEAIIDTFAIASISEFIAILKEAPTPQTRLKEVPGIGKSLAETITKFLL
jgi:crossover junction endonuclease MUS81